MVGEDIQISEHTENIKPLTGLGLRLKKARENLRLSEKEVATRLHLNYKVINTIENEDFVNGPPSVFMKGYIRSYARLLNMTETEITQAIERLELGINPIKHLQPLLNVTTHGVSKTHRHLRMITYLIVAILVSLVGLWWHGHTRYVSSEIDINKNQEVQTSNIPMTKPMLEKPTEPPLYTNDLLADVKPLAENSPEEKLVERALTNIASAAEKPTKGHRNLAHFKMAIPEPGLEP